MTSWANRFAAIPTHHYAILNLILILFYHLEECVDIDLFVYIKADFRRKTVPKHIFLLLGEFIVGFENREIILCGTLTKLIFPYAHPVAVPTLHASVIHTQRRVRDD